MTLLFIMLPHFIAICRSGRPKHGGVFLLLLLLLLLKRDYAGYMQTQTMTILQYTFVLMK